MNEVTLAFLLGSLIGIWIGGSLGFYAGRTYEKVIQDKVKIYKNLSLIQNATAVSEPVTKQLPPGWGYRIVPDGRIDLRPVGPEYLANCMLVASVPEDAATIVQMGGIIYVDSMELAEKIIALAGLENWGVAEDE